MAEGPLRFVQICATDADIWGLDSVGHVWRYQWADRERPEGWVPIAMHGLTPGPALGLTTVARTPDVR